MNKTIDALANALAKIICEPGKPEYRDEGRAALAQYRAEQAKEVVDMVLLCPKCGRQHIDAPDGQFIPGFTADESLLFYKHYGLWNNPPNRSNLCHGVAALETSGTDDAPVASPQSEQTEQMQDPVFKLHPSQVSERLLLIESVLKGYPAGLAHNDALDAVRSLAKREWEAASPQAAMLNPLTADERRRILDSTGDQCDGTDQDEWAQCIIDAVEATHNARLECTRQASS